jgi:hypothetical protein
MRKRTGTTTLNKIGLGTLDVRAVDFRHTDGTAAQGTFYWNVTNGVVQYNQNDGTNGAYAGFTVTNGATLCGTGTVNCVTAVVANAAILAPGETTNGLGTLALAGALNLRSGAVMNWQYNATAQDLVAVTGSVAVPAAATINIGSTDASAMSNAIYVVSSTNLSGWTVNGLPANYRLTTVGASIVLVKRDTCTIAATVGNADECGLTNGVFVISRTHTNALLAVCYAVSGTASNGLDFETLPGSVTIPDGASNAAVTVTALWDNVAESNETVVLTLLTNASYEIGTPSNATVTIVPSAIDNWKFAWFGASANSNNAQDTADYDGDGLPNLLEYALYRVPTAIDTDPIFTRVEVATNGYFTVYYTRAAALPDASVWVQVNTNLLTNVWLSASFTNAPVYVTETTNWWDPPTQGIKAVVINPPASTQRVGFVRLKVVRPKAE